MVKRVALLLSIALVGCRPDLEERTSFVDAPRLLAVRATPAEAKPGDTVTLDALFVDAKGTVKSAPLDWATCIGRKPLAASSPIAPSCLVRASEDLVPLGVAPSVSMVLPKEGCRLFGPDRPEAKPGEPSGRPVDPDGTGGYYQPLRLISSAGLAIADVRIRCGFAGATQAQVTELEARSPANVAPSIVSLDASGTPLTLEDAPDAATPIAKGSRVTLRLKHGKGEIYASFDPIARAVVARREGLRVSWYANAGTFAEERTGHGESDPPSEETTNTWTAPSEAARVVFWVVLRDDRGGVDFRAFRAEVR